MVVLDNKRIVFNKNDFDAFLSDVESLEKSILSKYISDFADNYMAKSKVIKGLYEFFIKRPNGSIRLDTNWY